MAGNEFSNYEDAFPYFNGFFRTHSALVVDNPALKQTTVESGTLFPEPIYSKLKNIFLILHNNNLLTKYNLNLLYKPIQDGRADDWEYLLNFLNPGEIVARSTSYEVKIVNRFCDSFNFLNEVQALNPSTFAALVLVPLAGDVPLVDANETVTRNLWHIYEVIKLMDFLKAHEKTDNLFTEENITLVTKTALYAWGVQDQHSDVHLKKAFGLLHDNGLLDQKNLDIIVLHFQDSAHKTNIKANKMLQGLQHLNKLNQSYFDETFKPYQGNPEVKKLLLAIDEMFLHGVDLLKKDEGKATVAMNLALKLKKKLYNFIKIQNPSQKNKKDFISTFLKTLHSEDNNFGESKDSIKTHRNKWLSIVKKIAIALTGIGLLGMLCGMSLFQVKTKREQYRDNIKSKFNHTFSKK